MLAMGSNQGQNIAPSRQTEVSEAMCLLGNVLVECEQEMEMLGKRLEAVRTQKPTPTVAQQDTKIAAQPCALADGIKSAAGRVLNIVMGLKTLQRELEL